MFRIVNRYYIYIYCKHIFHNQRHGRSRIGRQDVVKVFGNHASIKPSYVSMSWCRSSWTWRRMGAFILHYLDSSEAAWQGRGQGMRQMGPDIGREKLEDDLNWLNCDMENVVTNCYEQVEWLQYSYSTKPITRPKQLKQSSRCGLLAFVSPTLDNTWRISSGSKLWSWCSHT